MRIDSQPPSSTAVKKLHHAPLSPGLLPWPIETEYWQPSSNLAVIAPEPVPTNQALNDPTPMPIEALGGEQQPPDEPSQRPEDQPLAETPLAGPQQTGPPEAEPQRTGPPQASSESPFARVTIRTDLPPRMKREGGRLAALAFNL